MIAHTTLVVIRLADLLTARLSRRVADRLSPSAASEDAFAYGGGDAVQSTAVAIRFSCQAGGTVEKSARYTYGLAASVLGRGIDETILCDRRVTAASTGHPSDEGSTIPAPGNSAASHYRKAVFLLSRFASIRNKHACYHLVLAWLEPRSA